MRHFALLRAVFIVSVSTMPGLQPALASDPESGKSRLSELLSSGGVAGFATANVPREFSFPRDHGPHPGFRNEWWYVTGNLDADDGRRIGFELTFFRFALTPDSPESTSEWRTNQVYIAHFAVTDGRDAAFYVAERFSRGALGLAGAEADPFRVWIDDWDISAVENSADGERWVVRASDRDVEINLELVAAKSPVLNGVNGLSQKSSDADNASYYYSITRWQTDGTVRLGNDAFSVSGLSWLDREWSSSALASDQEGWDWFALQLSDGSELMFYNLRKRDGSQDAFSAGTWVSADGVSHHVDKDAIEITVLDRWSSPEGGSYPSGWEIRYPAAGIELRVTPVIDNQELFTTVRYWEGAVDVTGSRNGTGIEGRGYVELTGYAE